MDLKKTILGMLGINGIVAATAIVLTFAVYSIWLMPSNISSTITTAPGVNFFLCPDGTTQTGYCQLFTVNASTASNNATLNVSWSDGNGTNCIVKFVDSSLVELSDFSVNKTYTLPNSYAQGSTFGLKITRLNTRQSVCNFTIEPVAE